MGLASWVLSCIWKPLGLGMQAGKLIRECRDTRLLTGPRFLRITEEVVIFLVRQKNSKAALALYAGKIIWRRIQNSRKAGHAITIISALPGLSDCSLDDVSETAALRLGGWSSTEVQDAIAGVLYVYVVMNDQDLDSVTCKYRTKEGLFNAVACLRDFYGSPVPRLMVMAERKLLCSDLDLLIFWDSFCKTAGRNDPNARKLFILSMCMRDCSSHRTVYVVLKDALTLLLL